MIVVGAVIAHAGKVLCCRRAPGKASAGLWEFPGGKVEAGETPEQALAREIQEELDVPILVGDLILRATTSVDGREIDLACYWATLHQDAPAASTDHDEMVWLPITELMSLDWAKPDLAAVSRLIAQEPAETSG
ncbi:(deoxy)nucleoside triphosphate pyrophosphohydrolase [Subtercola endophyticus]|uniref:(deoxy)nucleoside triphosphate pyrophosphohydrolase n=1 Tax=Subtercola endophyticus TaxID=2895559 RepID=UPI001E5A92C9|nr:(deoxy)nucleoside triphosphate pyrophosphohydrolase [Subtercola endophyticus]UFS57612.1 (deoxy)nucleoside triphosphate pyrophosphohydrolase [Subtercola endophyticus]